MGGDKAKEILSHHSVVPRRHVQVHTAQGHGNKEWSRLRETNKSCPHMFQVHCLISHREHASRRITKGHRHVFTQRNHIHGNTLHSPALSVRLHHMRQPNKCLTSRSSSKESTVDCTLRRQVLSLGDRFSEDAQPEEEELEEGTAEDASAEHTLDTEKRCSTIAVM